MQALSTSPANRTRRIISAYPRGGTPHETPGGAGRGDRASGLGLAVLAAMAAPGSASGIEAPLGAPPAPGSYRLPCPESAGDGNVVTSDGEATTLHRLYAGRIVVLSLIYTHCADAQGCPWASFTWLRRPDGLRAIRGSPRGCAS